MLLLLTRHFAAAQRAQASSPGGVSAAGMSEVGRVADCGTWARTRLKLPIAGGSREPGGGRCKQGEQPKLPAYHFCAALCLSCAIASESSASLNLQHPPQLTAMQHALAREAARLKRLI
ncbi:hypothetical protein EMIHUDRAFT_209572 [Emiliania huxleyi CCMP1516]|uniref:Uncharacterized protein n=2 Tax=Emiliania huxleyi TaxID=2903 RepID=A0A0D3J5Y2_EMIH1|nr:hypothetical protein EMIHUDRAFT_209572 [Emiliania huxleyi CCMP1516]EOD18917.1 hypothetical protein EMIHUDRAFT_209572 [Emiliania huxleyi CCMP1516]|eukprot:XP_005771346.1 hypothetical protein EMIHUDRAFT_209572 [Emiliania huxleyi CCMP1516]